MKFIKQNQTNGLRNCWININNISLVVERHDSDYDIYLTGDSRPCVVDKETFEKIKKELNLE